MRPSWVPVPSLPSEKAPAPPSPNWTLASGSSSPPERKASTAFCRSSMRGPTLETMGHSPARARTERRRRARGPKARDEWPRPRGREPRYLVPGLGLRGFAAEADADGVDPAYRPTPACVKTPAEDDELLYVPRTDAEPLRREA